MSATIAVLENAEFSLYSDKECTKEIEKGKTDKNGQLNFDRISVGDFYLKETKAPDGYRLLKDPIKISLKNVNGITANTLIQNACL